MFASLIEETLAEAERLTVPLRRTLCLQTETGRLLPDLPPDTIIPATELFIRATGNLQLTNIPIPKELERRYRETYDLAILDEILNGQKAALNARALINPSLRKYFYSLERKGLVACYTSDGPKHHRSDWRHTYYDVGEFEEFAYRAMPTKMPAVQPFKLADGTAVHPHELLFLVPARALIEGRNGGILDVTRYMSIDRASSHDLMLALDSNENSIFSRYRESDADHSHKLNMHSLRHLQNAELFRLGIADTIITKRFGRRSVAQSHVYDHRSLAEDLVAIDVPNNSLEMMGPKAQEAFKLIMSGKVSGPLVEEFHRIQRELGDDVAFAFLDAEADGMHSTPFGFCLNSFMVDPCPKHLECFNGCLHLVLSPVPEDRIRLEKLRDRFIAVIAKLDATPAGGIGRDNQLTHARTRLANIEQALATTPGEKPFPDGQDFSLPFSELTGTTIIDSAKRLNLAD
jgi:hypothetical protein